MLTFSHSHPLSLSLSLSHSFNLPFTHSRHAEQLLFSCLGSNVTVYTRKLQWFFLDLHLHLLITLSCDSWVHRAGSQLKNQHGPRNTHIRGCSLSPFLGGPKLTTCHHHIILPPWCMNKIKKVVEGWKTYPWGDGSTQPLLNSFLETTDHFRNQKGF